MTLHLESLSIAASIVSVLVFILNGTRAILSIARLFARETKPIQSLLYHEDEDGVASEASVKTFSDTWQRVLVALLSAIGCYCTLSLAIITLIQHQSIPLVSFCQLVANSIVLCLEGVAFLTEPSSVKRYNLAIYAFWTSSLTIVQPCTRLISFAGDRLSQTPQIDLKDVSTGLLAVQIAVAILRGLCCLFIPRRPNVYYAGQVVDQEFSTCLFNRFTYRWVNGLLQYTVQNRSLRIENLPQLPFSGRVENLVARFEQARRSRRLWKAIVVAHWRPLVLQYLLSLAQSLLSFGPQVALYGILKSLEQRSPASSWEHATKPWLCTAALGLSLVLGSGLDSWLWWLTYSKLAVPVYQELTAVVFTKAMRCKDVAKQSIGDQGDECHENKGRQSTTNLAAVDSKRVSDFFLYNYVFSASIVQVFMSCAFLLSLVGWRSLLAGLAVGGLAMPLNAYATKRYSGAQEELMKATDRRTRLVTEVLQGIRQIKYAAMEQQWQDRITEKRNAELRMLWKTSLYNSLMVFIWTSIPVLLSSASLSVYALIHGNLTSSVAFTAMSVFGTLEFSLTLLPEMFAHWMEAQVSVDRIDTYLQSAEKAPHTTDVDCISFDDAKIAWPDDGDDDDDDDAVERLTQLDVESRFVLSNLTLRLPPKALTVISGKTGSGKSLLLSSILGECNVLAGSVKVPSAPSPDERYDEQATCANWIIDAAVAYVAQNPWIENGTIRQNILFGLPSDRRRYRQVLFASGLERDLNMFPDGDMTDIGANGVNLSGGQRWRISLARALYSRAGILVMDDVFSAVDAYTGRHLYEHALTGPLGQGRTRVLATHHVGLCLPQTDYCIVLANGTIKDAGTVKRLMDRGSLTHVLQEATTAESDNNKVQDMTVENDTHTASRHGRSSSVATVSTVNSHLAETEASPKKFTSDEDRATGSIALSVYATYIMQDNRLWLWALALLGYVLYMVLTVARSWWVNVWTNESNAHIHPGVSRIAMVRADSDLPFYLGTYIAISIAICVIGTVRYLAVVIAAIASCRRLFHNLLTPVLRAPVRWLDTVPLGRILNRLTSDVYVLDSKLGPGLSAMVNKFMQVLGILVAAVMVSPVLLVFACLLLVCCLQISHSYVAGGREMRRLESVTKSPVLEQFGSSISGLLTIRAFGKTQVYIDRMYSLIDCNARASWNVWLFSRWFGLRTIFLGAVFTTATAALVVYIPSMSASMAGFALSFALQFNWAVALTMRTYAGLEMDMNSTERVLEYTSLETEDQAGGLLPPAGWPTHGHIEVQDLVVGYAPELPPVLNGLSFRVEENQRVGVVGRTGAGKSSLTLALFRFLEARQGRIFIDGLDIAQLNLHDVRSRLAIIPQEPVLFSGTLRSNLDPFNEHSDLALYNALERVHLLSFDDTMTLHSQSTPASSSTIASSSSDVASNKKTSNMFSSLSSPISEGGANLSHGQRQLLCLARAIVSQPKIMILDEATSAVDMETDGLIQQSIRAEFGRNASSLLVIAHRLSTIADFDRILVMDAGHAVEFGTPRELLEMESSVFKNLVESSGEKTVVEQIIYSA